MTIRKRAILAALCAAPAWLPAATPIQTIRLEAAAQLRLDGHYYALPAGDIVLQSDGGYYAQQNLGMMNCHRSGGGDQVATGLQFRWTSGMRTVYLSPDSPTLGSPVGLEYADGGWTLTLRSTTGDIVCDGEVNAGSAVFLNGFE